MAVSCLNKTSELISTKSYDFMFRFASITNHKYKLVPVSGLIYWSVTMYENDQGWKEKLILPEPPEKPLSNNLSVRLILLIELFSLNKTNCKSSWLRAAA